MIWICASVVAFLALAAWIVYELKHAPTIEDDGTFQKPQGVA